MLKWQKNTPKKGNVGMLPCSSIHRVCPIDVLASATGCLFKYLLSGNGVMLSQEVPGKRNQDKQKNASHALINHKGFVFLHFLDTAMILLDSLPSIEQCAGGKVDDYRFEDLQSLVQRSRLVVTPGKGAPRRIHTEQLLHETKYFPLVRKEAIALDHPELVRATASCIS